MEPPRQYQPTKHCLGYVLMQAGNNQTAAEVGGPLHCDTSVLPNQSLVLAEKGSEKADACYAVAIADSSEVPDSGIMAWQIYR